MDKKLTFQNSSQRISAIFKKNEAVSVTLAVLLFLMLIISSPYALDPANIDAVQTAIAPYGIMSIGMMVLLISGCLIYPLVRRCVSEVLLLQFLLP